MKKQLVGIVAVAALVLVSIPFFLMMGTAADEAQKDDFAGCAADAPLSVSMESLKVESVGVYKKPALANAALIVSEAEKANLPRKAAVIALMTAMQESRLLNYANDGTWTYPKRTSVMTRSEWEAARKVVVESLKLPHQAVGHDWDSVGLFQQRPSAGWGTVTQLMNPSFAASTFYKRLKALDGWEDMSYNDAAQTIQRSGTPNAYGKHQADAESIVNAVAGVEVTSTSVNNQNCEINAASGAVSKNGWTQPVKSFSYVSAHFGEPRGGYPHAGTDFAAPAMTPILAAADGKVTRASCTDLVTGRSPCQIQISHGQENGVEISTLYVHMFESGVGVKVGQEVKAGERIGGVGTNGNSSGFHLHFEVWKGNTPVNAEPYLKEHGVTLKP